jgi:hypothetical protein
MGDSLGWGDQWDEEKKGYERLKEKREDTTGEDNRVQYTYTYEDSIMKPIKFCL